MPDSLETAALNGSLFTFDPTPPSPNRSASTASPTPSSRELNTDDELADSDEEGLISRGGGYVGQSSSARSRETKDSRAAQQRMEHDGPQTGPKGVVADRKAVDQRANQARERAVAERNLEQSRRALTALTVHGEQALRAREMEDDVDLREWRRRRKEELQRQNIARDRGSEYEEGHGDVEEEGPYTDHEQRYKRGGLREVGKEGFVDTVEQGGWVVVLIYEPGIPRCNAILASLLHLSLNLPPSLPTPISLYRARATSLAFSLLPPTSTSHSRNAEDEEDEDGQPIGEPDPDVLPTILAYKDGELEKTWVRVDWEVAEDGVEGLLRREGILSPVTGSGADIGRKGLLSASDSDDDDE